MLPTGRERRRTDLYGRARRFLYGALLAVATPGAMAADELGALGKYAAAVREGVRVDLQTGAGALHVKLNRSPEVRMEFSDSGGLKPAEAALKFNDDGGFTDEKIAQATVKWKF